MGAGIASGLELEGEFAGAGPRAASAPAGPRRSKKLPSHPNGSLKLEPALVLLDLVLEAPLQNLLPRRLVERFELQPTLVRELGGLHGICRDHHRVDDVRDR